ncbi:unnamed protein product [Pedinophyceae sp. YPF-701]|nr:unnamed protein product [Pedinophyceae sp. YPF-701]
MRGTAAKMMRAGRNAMASAENAVHPERRLHPDRLDQGKWDLKYADYGKLDTTTYPKPQAAWEKMLPMYWWHGAKAEAGVWQYKPKGNLSGLQEWQKQPWPQVGTIAAINEPMAQFQYPATRRMFPTENGIGLQSRWDKRIFMHMLGGLGLLSAHVTWCMWTDFKGASCAHKLWQEQNGSVW